jgi:hypothetical protein
MFASLVAFDYSVVLAQILQPQKVTDFIQNIINTPLEDIEAPLSRFTWDYDDKVRCELLYIYFDVYFNFVCIC